MSIDRVALVDIDGTLVMESARLQAQAAAVATYLQTNNIQEIVYAFFEINTLVANTEPAKKNNLPYYMAKLATHFGHSAGELNVEAMARAWAEAGEAESSFPVAYDDAKPFLSRLKAMGYYLMAVSGGTTVSRKKILASNELAAYFDVVVTTEEIGYQKQDARFWDTLQAQYPLLTTAKSVLVFGNQYNDDIEHPAQLGWQTFLILRPNDLQKIRPPAHIQEGLVTYASLTESLAAVRPPQDLSKILFIMQRVSPGTHMDYVYEMARTLHEERGLPLSLLLEKPSPLAPANDWTTTQHFSWAPLRALENLWLIGRARFTGTKTFYVHYSFLSAITAGIVTRLFGGQVYYWNAGMPWLYTRSWQEEWYQRIAYKLIHTLVTGAESLRAGYCETYGLRPEQVVVIPNWIDLTHIAQGDGVGRTLVRERLGIATDAPVVLFVQKHSRRKGAHLLPDIWAGVTVPDAHLIIAGDGPLRAALETAFIEKGLSSRVHFVGSLPRSAVAELYEASDVYLLPSEEEGSPHALIEALAYGLPAVTSDVGGVRETMTEHLADFVLPYGATDQFAQKLSLLLGDRATREEIGLVARRVAAQYEKSHIVDRFYRLLSQNSNK
jgi:glycosyltransferase involved in cell wall biosynthesis/phosphoglycolate phosphatase-like HAD superfamily hydrolase